VFLVDEGVAGLEHEPIFSLAARLVVLDLDEVPTALHAPAVQGDVQVALLVTRLDRILGIRSPEASVPQHHGAAAILAFGNHAFEIAVVEGVRLGLNRQPLVVGI
jgi:hypothetical protein